MTATAGADASPSVIIEYVIHYLGVSGPRAPKSCWWYADGPGRAAANAHPLHASIRRPGHRRHDETPRHPLNAGVEALLRSAVAIRLRGPATRRVHVRADLVSIAYNDIVGMTRAKSILASDLSDHLDFGIGWTPANQALTALGPIAAPNPWGPMGDVRLVPDSSTETRVQVTEEGTPLHLLLGSVNHTDGAPWGACTRHFLRRALDRLAEETGLRIRASFEIEFFAGTEGRRAVRGFGLDTYREVEPLGSLLMGALDEMGLEPEQFLAEYGPGQFEFTCRPAAGMAAADRAILADVALREVANHLGLEITRSPVVGNGGPGNGVHVHLSLETEHGENITHDPEGSGGLSSTAQRFAAGILHHLPALCAVTAPSPVSYERLQPQHWSAAYRTVGVRNREAAVRVAPVDDRADRSPKRMANIEYRPADATASPYLLLGALVQAGLEGILASRELPALVDVDPAELSESEREAIGATRLPASLGDAMDALEADEVARSWFPNLLWDCYRQTKRFEIEQAAELEESERVARFADVY